MSLAWLSSHSPVLYDLLESLWWTWSGGGSDKSVVDHCREHASTNWFNVVSMVGQRLRRWPTIETTLNHRLLPGLTRWPMQSLTSVLFPVKSPLTTCHNDHFTVRWQQGWTCGITQWTPYCTNQSSLWCHLHPIQSMTAAQSQWPCWWRSELGQDELKSIDCTCNLWSATHVYLRVWIEVLIYLPLS